MSLLITCPICGGRNGYEFRYGGEDHGPLPEAPDISPEQWVERVHNCDNIGGVRKEWWCHRDGCGSWFAIHRNTLTNRQVGRPEEAP